MGEPGDRSPCHGHSPAPRLAAAGSTPAIDGATWERPSVRARPDGIGSGWWGQELEQPVGCIGDVILPRREVSNPAIGTIGPDARSPHREVGDASKTACDLGITSVLWTVVDGLSGGDYQDRRLRVVALRQRSPQAREPCAQVPPRRCEPTSHESPPEFGQRVERHWFPAFQTKRLEAEHLLLQQAAPCVSRPPAPAAAPRDRRQTPRRTACEWG